MTRGFRPEPFPPGVALPITVSAALARGLRQGRLRRTDLERRVRGVRGRAGAAEDRAERAGLFLERMPASAVLSHGTAAGVWGIPLPRSVEDDPRVHVAVPYPARAPHAAGIAGHSLQLDEGDTTVRVGLRVTSPGRTWVDMARLLDLPDLVAAGDFLIRWRHPLVDAGELLDRASRRSRQTGRRRLLTAVELLEERSESRRESHLRVLLVRAGFPRPECNLVLRREGGGHFRLDLAYPDRKIAIEYQGDHHRDRAQWLADLRRRAELERMGWTVIEVTAEDLRDPLGLLARLRAEFAR